jgi:hypothetical protein
MMSLLHYERFLLPDGTSALPVKFLFALSGPVS